jgi:hypothetical protein
LKPEFDLGGERESSENYPVLQKTKTFPFKLIPNKESAGEKFAKEFIKGVQHVMMGQKAADSIKDDGTSLFSAMPSQYKKPDTKKIDYPDYTVDQDEIPKNNFPTETPKQTSSTNPETEQFKDALEAPQATPTKGTPMAPQSTVESVGSRIVDTRMEIQKASPNSDSGIVEDKVTFDLEKDSILVIKNTLGQWKKTGNLDKVTQVRIDDFATKLGVYDRPDYPRDKSKMDKINYLLEHLK